MATATSAASTAAPERKSVELAARKRRFSINVVVAIAVAAVMWVLPMTNLPSATLRFYALTMLYIIAVMGLNLVFGFAGQVTLGPAATFALGAYGAGLLAAKHHWNPMLAIVAGIVIATIGGAIIGLPALRVGGFYLAMVTAYAAAAIPAAVIVWRSETNGDDGLLVPSLRYTGNALHVMTQRDAFRLIVIVTLLSAYFVGNTARSSWGRWFRCLAVSSVGTSSLGISVYRARVYAFLLSAAWGGLAGGFYAEYQNIISPEVFSFNLSLAFFVAAVIGGLGTLWGPVLGTIFYYFTPRYILPQNMNANWTQVIYGVLLIVLMIVIPAGLVEALRDIYRFVGRKLGLLKSSHAGAVEVAAERTSEELPALLERAGAITPGTTVLKAEHVTKNFGGVRALDDAHVEVWAGKITALIGPNGSGKTTLLNVCSGFLKPDAGAMTLQGNDVSSAPGHKRSSLGMARTFQQPIVFGALNGAQNVMAGYSRNRPDPISATLSLPNSMRFEKEAAIRAESLLDALGAGHLSQKQASHATLAEQRIIDLARALALDPIALLLDEPAAGLDLDEIAVLEALVRAAAQSGVAVLLVEHDVGFVTRLADHVTVLDRGRVIADADPVSVRNDPAVKAAYFGDVEMEEALVG
jgi:ABC-type branched-subunit amino acid transport system ATPase component/ABC-type branched-subunit amino acid transport system permease subunit